MTAAAHAALDDELKRGIPNERPQLVKRIQQAVADDPNLVENSERQAALADHGVNEIRVAQLGLARAEIINLSKLSGISQSCLAKQPQKMLRDGNANQPDSGEKQIYQIVAEPEANVSKGKISVGSPIGRAVMASSRAPPWSWKLPGAIRPT